MQPERFRPSIPYQTRLVIHFKLRVNILVLTKQVLSRKLVLPSICVFLLASAIGCTTQTVNAPTAIQHTVFIIKENRTFDNYFGGFPGADGAVKGTTSTGKVVNLSPMADSSPINLCNNWDCAWKAYD